MLAPIVAHTPLNDPRIEWAAADADEQRGGGFRLRMVAEPDRYDLANDGQDWYGPLFPSFAGDAEHGIGTR